MPRRTKAALAAKVLAVEEAVRVLESANVRYTQPLFGKLVIEPPSAVQGGKSVTFWHARERLRIGRRATQRQQNIPAFEQALADQGHRIPGYASRPARLSKSPSLSREERLRARQEADLAEMEHAHAQLMASLRQMTKICSLAGELGDVILDPLGRSGCSDVLGAEYDKVLNGSFLVFSAGVTFQIW